MINSTNSISTPASLGGTAAPAKTPASDAAASQDRFLKLLVAQLNNQDPMNPMDNAQMTSQMAQINTVTGIQQLHETVKGLSSQFNSMQVLQGASMVGRGVMLQGDKLSIDAGQAQGAFDLAGNADKVSVQILSPGGQLIDSIDMGSLSAGRHDFSWDASSYQGVGNPVAKITATQGSNAVSSTPFVRDTVTGVGTDNGAMSVQLKGRSAVAYSAIASIL